MVILLCSWQHSPPKQSFLSFIFYQGLECSFLWSKITNVSVCNKWVWLRLVGLGLSLFKRRVLWEWVHCCMRMWELVSQFLDSSCCTSPTKFQIVLLLLVSKPSSSGQNKPYALRNCRATVWCKGHLPVFSRGEAVVSWRTVTVACVPVRYLSLATHLMVLHISSLFLHVQCFAANAKNYIAILQNLSAVSIGNDLDFFPADSDIPEEITIRTSQRFARQCRKSLCCKPALFFPSLTKVLGCLF